MNNQDSILDRAIFPQPQSAEWTRSIECRIRLYSEHTQLAVFRCFVTDVLV